MERGRIDRFRYWLEYENDAHGKALASLATVPDDRRGGEEFRRAASILGHLVLARRIWLARVTGATPPPAPTFFPESTDLGALAADWKAVFDAWADYLARSDEAELDRTFEYRSLDGKGFRNRVEDILTQLFGHSWYHRGQVAMLVRAAGGEPILTDFVLWCREPLPE